MKHATLSWLAALSLLGSATFAAAQQPIRSPQAPAASPAPQAAATPRAAPAGQPQAPAGQPQAPQAGQAPQAAQPPQAAPARAAPGGARAERRRRSYASCNRASHQRGLHGGKRRRFLIRCRLGYERPRQPPAAQAPAQPGPRP